VTKNSQNKHQKLAQGEQEESVSDWARTSRYLALKTIQAAKDPEPIGSPQPPKKRVTRADKDALLTAALILIVVAGAAFFAGLL
jgi:hypothetical protein